MNQQKITVLHRCKMKTNQVNADEYDIMEELHYISHVVAHDCNLATHYTHARGKCCVY